MGVVLSVLPHVAGCVATDAVPATSRVQATRSAPTRARTADHGVPGLARTLTAALAAPDRDAFLAAFDGSAHARALGGLWFDNLSQFVDVTFTAAAANPAELTVTSRLPGEGGKARHQVGVATTGDGTARISRLVVGDRDPLWAVEAVDVHRGPASSVVLGDGSAGTPEEWVARAERAIAALDEARLGPLIEGWDRHLVVEVPGQATSFARVSGQSVRTAAVTSIVGDSVRIVVNPVAAAAPEAASLDALVLHEAVHVAADTPSHPTARRWIVEGLAEWVVGRSEPGFLAESDRLVGQRLDAGPAPAALPTDGEVVGGGPDPLTGYALARVAVAAMVAESGRPAAMDALAVMLTQPASAWHPSEQVITRWYLDALGRR